MAPTWVINIEELWHVLYQVMEELVGIELVAGIVGELRLG